MFSPDCDPIQIEEPTKCIEWSVDTDSIFTKKIIDNNQNCFFVEINVLKKTGTITQYSDRRFTTPCDGKKFSVSRFKNANHLFGEAEFRYKGITMPLR